MSMADSPQKSGFLHWIFVSLSKSPDICLLRRGGRRCPPGRKQRFLRKSSANSHARKAPLGHKGSWPNGPEGIRTLQISENSELCNKSPPSFSSKMPPPLTVRGTARGGFSSAPQLIDTTNRQTGSARK